MRNFPKADALLLKGLLRAYDELPRLEELDKSAKEAAPLPGGKKYRSLATQKKKNLSGRLLSNVLESLERHGFGDTAERCRRQATLKRKYDRVLREFLDLLESERGPVETWPDLLIGPESGQQWPKTVEDLMREWGL